MNLFDKLTNIQTWDSIINKVLEWMVSTVPSILFILLLVFITLKIFRILLNKFKDLNAFRIKKTAHDNLEEAQKRSDTLIGILAATGKISIWVVALMIMLRAMGIDIAPLIAGAGIIGLAVGFGAQELVRDVISGFFILLEDHVRAGDVAVINGTGGLVESIGLRTVTLRDFSGTVHIMQNGKINSLSNMTKEWSAVVFDVGVAYKEDPDNVMEVMREVATKMEQDDAFKDLIIEPLEIFGVDQFADSAVVIRARYKTMPIKQWTVGREYRKRLKKAFDAHNIEIPFPHRTIYWGEEIKPLELETKEKKQTIKKSSKE